MTPSHFCQLKARQVERWATSKTKKPCVCLKNKLIMLQESRRGKIININRMKNEIEHDLDLST